MNMRTDLEIVQYPDPLPNFGGLLGAGTIQTDPNFGTKIMRLTDGAVAKGGSIQTADGAQAGIWNHNDTLLLVRAVGGAQFLYQFEPTSMTAQKLSYTTADRACFSKVNPGLLYRTSKGVVYVDHFSLVNGVWTFQSSATVCDFKQILPAGFVISWSSMFLISENDSTISYGVSSGAQGTGIYVCVWQRGRKGTGMRLLNTQTGEITGDWGAIGKAVLTSSNCSIPFSLHEAVQTPHSNYIDLSPAGNDDDLFWETNTLQITSCEASGHKALGMAGWFGGGPGGGQIATGLYTAPATHRLIVPAANLPKSQGQNYKEDSHYSFGKYVSNDNSIIWTVAAANGVMPFQSAWENEVRGYNVATGVVYRACHTFDSNQSKQFIVLNAIGCPSPTGKFVAFTSDIMGTLGSVSGGAQGTLGVDARGDVFIVKVG